MKRQHLVALALALLVVGASTVGVDASKGKGNGPPSNGGGGISGGGPSGGGGLGAFGSCGAGRILAVYDNAYWNNASSAQPYASATQTSATNKADKTQFKDHIYPTYTKHDASIVFLIDPTNGYAWGPSDLDGYSATRGTPPGEGFPPNFTAPFDSSGSPPATWNKLPSWYNAGFEDWSCFDGTLPTVDDPVPLNFDLSGLSHGSGDKTITNIPAGGDAVVFDKITASPSSACTLYSDAPNPASDNVQSLLPLNTGGANYPSGGEADYHSTGSTGCPNFGLNHGQTAPTGTWTWYEYEFPVTSATKVSGLGTCLSGASFTASPTVSACPPSGLDFGGGTCNSGSGYVSFDWEPNPYVPSANSPDCGTSTSDQQQFIHVHNKTTTKAAGPCTASGCGLNVTMAEKWGAYECLGTISNKTTGETWTWRIFTGQTMSYTFPKTNDSFSLTCNQAVDQGFVQTYDTSAGVPVEQIESVPNGH